MGALRLPRREMEKQSYLRVVKDKVQQEIDTNLLIDSAWSFAQSALWNTSVFSENEVKMAKVNIEFLLISSKNQKKAFLEFVQRVILARQYVLAGQGRYVPLPSVWLDGDNEKGFPGTRQWFADIKKVRESLPFHKSNIHHLAEAALEYSLSPCSVTYQTWKEFLLHAGAADLFTLFQMFIVNLSFEN